MKVSKFTELVKMLSVIATGCAVFEVEAVLWLVAALDVDENGIESEAERLDALVALSVFVALDVLVALDAVAIPLDATALLGLNGGATTALQFESTSIENRRYTTARIRVKHEMNVTVDIVVIRGPDPLCASW